jgi:hypothetical protein
MSSNSRIALTIAAVLGAVIAGQLMSHGLSYALRSSADGWSWEPRPMMVTKPPIDAIQFPGEQWYDLSGPPGIYECSH